MIFLATHFSEGLKPPTRLIQVWISAWVHPIHLNSTGPLRMHRNTLLRPCRHPMARRTPTADRQDVVSETLGICFSWLMIGEWFLNHWHGDFDYLYFLPRFDAIDLKPTELMTHKLEWRFEQRQTGQRFPTRICLKCNMCRQSSRVNMGLFENRVYSQL